MERDFNCNVAELGRNFARRREVELESAPPRGKICQNVGKGDVDALL